MNNRLMVAGILWMLVSAPLHARDDCRELNIGLYADFPIHAAVKERMEAAYKAIGCSFVLVSMPSPRSLEAADSGILDGELIRRPGLNQQYHNLLPIPEPVWLLKAIAVTPHQHLVNIPISELNRLRRGSFLGVLSYDYLGIQQQGLFQVKTAGQLLKMLLSGRIEVALVPSDLLTAWQAETKIPLYELNEPVGFLPLHHYLHKRHEALVQPLNQAILDLKIRESQP